MNRKYYNEQKIFSALVSMAFISIVVYMSALFRVERTHAAEPIVFANVSIEDGSMRPVAVDLNLKTNVYTKTGTNLNENASATATRKTSVLGNSTSTNTNAKNNGNRNGNETRINNSSEDDIDLPVNINTSDDLDLYMRLLEQEDKDVSKIEVQEDRILLAYRQPAKFLGFIPVSVIANVKVDAQGNVSVDYPWYTILSVKDDAKLKEELQLKMAEILGGGTGVSGTITSTTTIAFSELSVRSRAKIIQAIHVALKNNVEEKDHN